MCDITIAPHENTMFSLWESICVCMCVCVWVGGCVCPIRLQGQRNFTLESKIDFDTICNDLLPTI